jgi:aspartyl-tRNA(Asn)/glutamyl-tRNA(Gln) amidotransferase subunit C
MTVEKAQIERLAKLSRLELSEEEKVKLQTSLSDMVGYMEKLKSLDLSAVEPMMRVDESVKPLRPDVPRESLSTEEVFRNAPKENQGHFSIPKTVT